MGAQEKDLPNGSFDNTVVTMAIKGLKRKAVKPGKKSIVKFYVDLSQPAEDNIVDGPGLSKFLMDRIKVDGKTGNLGDAVKISTDKSNNSKVVVQAELPFSKQYIKYLAKKYLKKNNLRDFVRVVAKRSDKLGYEFRYFQMAQEEENDE